MTHRNRIVPAPRFIAAWCVVCALGTGTVLPAFAQTAPSRTAAAASGEGKPWAALTPAQQQALRPLQREWNTIDAQRKVKWIEVADRMPRLAPAERERIQERMTDWAQLTPRQRAQARLNYRELQQLPVEDRRARWEAYKSLPPDQQRQLAERASPAKAAAAAQRERRNASSEKSTLVPNTAYAARPTAVAPTVAQARPGATTNLVTKRPSPPPHQQPGLPKIPTGSTFVDSKTLLPKRGAQGAAARSARAASGPLDVPRP